MSLFDEYPSQFRPLLEKLASAGYADILLDAEKGNQFLFDAMSRAEDATLREMGSQLRDGAVSFGQVAETPYYRDAIDHGLERLRGLDPERLETDLDAALAETDRQAEEPDPSRDDDDRDDRFPAHGSVAAGHQGDGNPGWHGGPR